MELRETFYYDHTKFPNVLYLVNMALERYFSKEVFRNNATRVFYSSEEYAFRRRMNLLSESGEPSINAMDFPFMCYYRQANWEIDKEKALGQNATAALYGFEDSNINNMHIRFLNVKGTFECTAFFTTDKDAQLAYEILLWIASPSPKQFTYNGIAYKGYNLDIPITFHIKDINFNPTYKEKDWLEKNKILPIKFTLDVHSTILSQSPQSSESSLFVDETPPTIAESAIFDFFAYKGTNQEVDKDHLDFEVTATFNPDPELLPTISTSNITQNQVIVSWNYSGLIDPTKYETNVLVTLNGFKEYSVPMSTKTLNITDLSEGSEYQIIIWFTKKDGTMAKVSTTITTIEGIKTGLKGMIGYTF